VLYRFTVFDAIAKLDTDTWSETCSGAKWLSDSLDLALRVDVNQYECIYGLVGIFLGDSYDCDWVLYPLSRPLFSVPLIEEANVSGDYSEYECKENRQGQMNIKPTSND
jgi:hypothetical protein